MARPQTKYTNNMQAIQAIDDYVKSADRQLKPLTIRPYNYHSPEFSPWWFIPSNDWPAYNLNKLFIRTTIESDEARQYMFMGYYIEKGFSALAQAPQKYVMTPRWHWHKFLDLSMKGEMQSVAQSIILQTNCPIRIEIDMYDHNHNRESDSGNNSYDRVEYSMSQSNLDLNHAGKNELSFLNVCTDFQSIGSQFKKNAELTQFFWIDFRIGIGLNYFSGDDFSWEASSLWKKGLKPWLALF